MGLITDDTAKLARPDAADPVTPGHDGSGCAAAKPDQSRSERTRSFDPADFPRPTGREEEWRFTPVDRLGAFFRDETTGASLEVGTDIPEGVTASTISVQEWRALGVPAPADRAAAVAAARSGGVTVVDIPRETTLAQPVRLTLGGEGDTLVHGHLMVRAGRFSRGTVVLEHTGSADHAEVVTILAEDGADLTVVTTQEWADGTLHVGQHDVVVGRDARVRHVAVSLGGSLVRLDVNATYAGPGGSFEGLGVYLADDGQHLEHRLFVDHEAPRCQSNVEYKGALLGETAHTVWIGDVLIRAAAEGTETYEINRNLVLTDGARADSVPNLEIETGEIAGAGHASATGRFDDEQLFYLQARGIPADEARRLVLRGFFAAIVDRIGIDEIEERLMGAIDAELGHVAPAGTNEEDDA